MICPEKYNQNCIETMRDIHVRWGPNVHTMEFQSQDPEKNGSIKSTNEVKEGDSR